MLTCGLCSFISNNSIIYIKTVLREKEQMKENEEKLSSIEAQKAKIRQRYKGIDADELDVIPALPQENFYEG